ncbi:MAG: radical SAM protein [Gammaproteobacteria bacterium]|nr:radical SAM protein [Gammaproteobacteria bacterium]
MEETICIINLSNVEYDVGEAWELSGFLQKIDLLTKRVFVWDERIDNVTSDTIGLAKIYDKSMLIDLDLTTSVILIEANQLFFDVGIAKNALRQFKKHNVDYLTQWEHCRLPVGVGVRVFALNEYLKSDITDLSVFVKELSKGSITCRRYYDPNLYVGYTDSLLDSRKVYSEEGLMVESVSRGTWGLSEFLVVKNAQRERWVYSGDVGATAVDERGMESLYGFESDACRSFPGYVMFDLTNKCNATCQHCPHAVGFPGDEKTEYLDIEYFKKAIDECVGRNVGFIRITADGEPLLHPQVWDLLSYGALKNVAPIGLTTNGSALNKQNVEKLLSSNIFMVDISLDAATDQTFRKVRVGLSYEKVHQNIEFLLKRRVETGSKLKVMVSFVKQHDNIDEVEAFKDKWEPIVDKVLIREMISNVGINAIDSSGYGQNDRWPCPHWFRRIVINYDMQLKACPIDWRNESVLGSGWDIDIYEAWHSDYYHKNRLEHLNNRYSKDSLCTACYDWRGTTWNLGYEKVIGQLKDNQSVNQ